MTSPECNPCAVCDAFLATLPDDARAFMLLLSRYLADQAVTGEHLHLAAVALEQLEACNRVLKQETADRVRVEQLLSYLGELSQLYREEGETMRDFLIRVRDEPAPHTLVLEPLVQEILAIETRRTDYFGGVRLLE